MRAFLSTPPSRVATKNHILHISPPFPFLSTPPSRVATPGSWATRACPACFYPRHPRGWRRSMYFPQCGQGTSFYPRHPRGWRPINGPRRCPSASVSIHATLAGGDNALETELAAATRFYPRHPRGWRLFDAFIAVSSVLFLSTPPSRVATGTAWLRMYKSIVSIHATLAGGDEQ